MSTLFLQQRGEIQSSLTGLIRKRQQKTEYIERGKKNYFRGEPPDSCSSPCQCPLSQSFTKLKEVHV